MSRTEDEKWDLIIEPKKKLLDIDWAGIWQYRDLFKMYVKRDIITVYKQTVLGPLWFLISPLLTTFVYMVIFNKVAKVSTGDVPAPLFYMSGQLLWNYFTACFTTGQNTFTGNSNVFSKVFFPRLVVPLAGIASGLIKTLIQSVMLIIIYVYCLMQGYELTFMADCWVMPILLLLIALLGMGMGLIVSSLTVKYRDLNNLVIFGLQLGMYVTPVIYPVTIASGTVYEKLLRLNPLQSIFDDFRYMITGIGEMDWSGLGYSAVFTFVVLFLGIIIFNREERTFMDTI